MSDLIHPLMGVKHQEVLPSSSLKFLPEMLIEKQKSLLSECVSVNDFPSGSGSDCPSSVLATNEIITSILSHSDGTLTYSTESGQICRLTASLNLIQTYEESSNIHIFKLLQSPDEKTLVALSKANFLQVYKGGEKLLLEGHNGVITNAALTNNHIATCDTSFIVYIWDSNSL